MVDRRRVLILAGTSESAALARRLARSHGIHPVSSLAGRTRSPAKTPGETRVGGFGGVEGMTAYLRAAAIDAVVDATHPFARQISAHAAKACSDAGIPRVALVRPPWQSGPGDNWREVASAPEAAACLSEHGRRVFLALGHRDLAPFAGVRGTWFLIRAIEAPDVPAGIDHALVLDRGPFEPGAERALLERHRIDAIVARNSGGDAARGKLDAARALGLPVVLIARPPPPPAPVVSNYTDAMDWLQSMFESRLA